MLSIINKTCDSYSGVKLIGSLLFKLRKNMNPNHVIKVLKDSVVKMTRTGYSNNPFQDHVEYSY